MRHPRIATGLVFALTATLLTFATARVQADDAKEQYARGLTLFEGRDFTGAADAFRAAYAAKPSWKVLFNIAQAEASAKRHGLALEAFEAYLSEGGDDLADDRREEVIGEVERLRKMVGSVEIVAPDGALVMVDGVERGKAPLLGKLPIAASVPHTVWAEVDGAKVGERPFKVMGGDSLTVELGREKAVAVAPVVEEEKGEGSSNLATIGWISVAVGGAMVIAGGITGGMALNLDDELYQKSQWEDEDEGTIHVLESKENKDTIDKMNNLALATDVLLFVGGAAAATGIVFLIVDKVRGDDEGEAEVAFVPSAGPGFAGAAVAGRF